jgi:hypothetical protein
MINFQFIRVTSPKAAVEAISKDSSAQWIAGGTNLVDLMKKGVTVPEKLIDINNLPWWQCLVLSSRQSQANGRPGNGQRRESLCDPYLGAPAPGR